MTMKESDYWKTFRPGCQLQLKTDPVPPENSYHTLLSRQPLYDVDHRLREIPRPFQAPAVVPTRAKGSDPFIVTPLFGPLYLSVPFI